MKSDVHKKIIFIEQNFPVECIKYQDIVLWPYIRTLIFGMYESGFTSNANKVKTNKSFYILKKLRNCLSLGKKFIQSIVTTNFKLFFKKEAVFIFTDTLETRSIDGKLISKIEAEVVNSYNNIIPVYQVVKNTKKAFRHYINREYINIIIQIKSKFQKINKDEIKGIEILNNICNELSVNFDLMATLKQIIVTKKFYYKLYKRLRPAKIFVNCYYEIGKISMVAAAKELDIPVIEMQHGLITEGHLAYDCVKCFKNTPYPDYIFVFGDAFKRFISEGIYPSDKIKTVGSYYIDLVRSRKEINQTLFNKRYLGHTQNKIIITVASQWTIDKELLNFYMELAKRNPEYFVIFKVRPFENYHKQYMNQLPNFVIDNELDTYICMQNSNITSTVNSTCAVESLALGVPVLLIDIDNLSTSTMKPILGDGLKSVDYVNSIEQAEESITKLKILDRDLVLKEGSNFFANNHKELLKNVLTSLEEK